MATKKKTSAKKPVPVAKHAPAKKPLKAPVKHVPTKPAPAATPAPAAKKSATPFQAKAAGSKPPLNAADLKRMLLERKSAPKAAIAFSLDEVREIALKNEKQIEGTVKTAKSDKAIAAAKQAEALAKLEKNHKPNQKTIILR